LERKPEANIFKRYQRLFASATITGKWLRVLGAFASMTLLLVVLRAGTNTVIASDSFNRTLQGHHRSHHRRLQQWPSYHHQRQHSALPVLIPVPMDQAL